MTSVSGTVGYDDGRDEPIDRATLMGAPEAGLRVLAAATVALGLALVLRHVGP